MAIPTTTHHYYFPQLGALENLTLKESPLSLPKSSEVLVKIHAVSLQYRDLVVAKGQYNARIQESLVPCSDMAGEIIGVGEDVKCWKKGDRVSANLALDHLDGDTTHEIQSSSLGGQSHGVLTEYRSFPAHSLVRIPEHLSYEEASTLPCAAVTAYNAFRGPHPLKGADTVLVLGTGGVSIFALQLAVAFGATVIATSSSDDKLKIASSLGAKHVINYAKTPDWDEEVLRITNGRGVDHVVEVGGAGTLARSLKAVRFAGSIHVIGFVSQENSDVAIVRSSIRKALMLRGIQIGSVAQFRDMNRLISAHNIRPVICKVFGFEDAMRAFKYLERQSHVGKVVIKVSDV